MSTEHDARTNSQDTNAGALATPDAIEGELVDDPAPRQPVDPPLEKSPPPWSGDQPARRPVVAPWLRQRDQRRAAERWAAGYLWHWFAFHTVRAPMYLVTMLAQAPRGAARLGRRLVAWLTDAEAHPLRAAAVRREDSAEYLKLARERADRVRLRRIATAGLVVAGGLVYVALQFAPWWAQATVAAAVVVVFAYAGRPLGRPWIGPAVEAPKVRPLTSGTVVKALGSLGLGELNKALAKNPSGAGLFPAPITRDGPGWRADVELPEGVTVEQVIDRRAQLASGLRRRLGCVWPEPATDDHPGRLVLWVGDEDMAKAKQSPWPLARKGAVDLFEQVAFGTDQRGRWVHLTLMFTSVVIGAIPRMGKTFALRLLLLIAALDPRVQLHAYDNKGTGDLSALAPVAHGYGVGDDEDDLETELEEMRALRTELRRRTKVIRELPRDLCPENKVTPELAGKASLGLHPVVIGVDECQVWFEHPEYGGEFEAICTDLVKRGPALGMILILATQRPDAKSLPTGISANASTRFCLKVMGQVENDMVLGTSRYKAGVRATMFGWDAKGIGYLVGDGSDAQITRTVFVDGPGAERITARARAAREAVGNITGHAAGEQTERAPAASLLDDLNTVFASAERTDRMWSERVCELLGELRPEVYGGWTADALGVALRPLGIETRQLAMDDADGERRNRKGIRREQVVEALATRSDHRAIGRNPS